MATIQRPVKTYGTRSYVAEVAAAPGNEDPVLAIEVDGDLDTIYSAWNGGVDTVNIKDTAVTAAKLAADAKPWQIVGATVALTDPTKLVQWGASTIKHYLNDAAGSLQLQTNYGTAINDTSKPQWMLALSAASDIFAIYRSPAGTTAAFATTLTVDSVGRLTLGGAGGAVYLNPRAGVMADAASGNSVDLGLNADATYPGYDQASSGWLLRMQRSGAPDNLVVFRRTPATTSFATLFMIDNIGTITTATTGAAVRITGTGTGIRCQNVGTMAGDGYSNAVAFGYTGSVPVRVDSTQMGTMNITPPSDARYKLDVQEDVPGLDAVCALRPVSFVYDQTQRKVGFPLGRYYGLIAQEAQAHVPLVIEDDGTDEHFLGLDYRLLVPVLIRAMQELAARVTALEAR